MDTRNRYGGNPTKNKEQDDAGSSGGILIFLDNHVSSVAKINKFAGKAEGQCCSSACLLSEV